MGFSQAKILELVVISFCKGSSQLRDQTRDPCIGILESEPLSNPRETEGHPGLRSSGIKIIHQVKDASKVMLKILQARLQQYVNQELSDVQAGFRKGRGTRDQVANTHCIIEKAKEFQKNIYFCFID